MMHDLTESHLPALTSRSKDNFKINNGASQKRLRFLQRGLILGFITVLLFLVTDDLQSGSKIDIATDLFDLSAFVIIYLISLRVKKNIALLSILTILSISLTTAFALYGLAATRSIFLAPVTPLIGYLLLSRKGGVLATVFMEACIIVVYLLDKLGIVVVQLDAELMLYGAISTIVISALMFVYEGINIDNEKLIVDRENQLNEQLEKNRIANEDLADTLAETQNNNLRLSNTKAAIMNILEDTNELQAQLRSEKENIEQTVMERTEQLRQEQARLRASVNSLKSGFLMTFMDDQKAIYNPALQELLGLNDKEDKNHGNTTLAYIKRVQSKIGKSFDLDGAIKNSLKKGLTFSADNVEVGDKFISIIGAPIVLNGQDQAIGCVVLMDDNTAEMLLERSKDEFISIASHELRTPLTAIRGNASMLETMYGEQMPNADAKEMLSDIKDSSVRLIAIVNQFLSTSRLEQKRTEFVMATVDIGKSIVSSVDQIKTLADEKKLNIIVKVPDNLPLVLTDETRTQEILINIIGNAVKYTEKGEITVSAKEIKGFVEIDVEDTGQGIDEKNQSLLFHKFQQASSNILTRDDSRSTGLGLYITKLLIEQMGGTIYLKKSKIGQGSTFSFTLPITRVKV